MINHLELDKEIFKCDKCEKVKDYRAYPMPGFYGDNCFEKFAVIAQNPGLPNEYQKSKSFAFIDIEEDYIDGLKKSPIGAFLDLVLPSSVSLDQVFYTNTVKCAAEPGSQLIEEISNCSLYLRRQLEIIKPKIIITLGGMALNFFRPGMSIKAASLKRLQGDKSYTIIPLFHPSYISRLDYDKGKKYIEDANREIAFAAKWVFYEK
jgi:uracil-DNA glycosylase family 4